MRPVYNDELYHFGIPGMKWGHKTSSIKDARKNLNSLKINWQDSKTTYDKIANGKISKKSTQLYNTYKESEKKYLDARRLSMEKTSMEKASKIVGTTLGVIGGLTLAAYAASRK